MKFDDVEVKDGHLNLNFIDDGQKEDYDPVEDFIKAYYNQEYNPEEVSNLVNEYNEIMEHLKELCPTRKYRRKLKKRNRRLAKYDSYVKTKDGFDVELNGLKGKCDKLGKEIIPCILEDGYKSVDKYNGVFIVLDKNDIYHIYDKSGKELSPYKCEKIEFSDGSLIVRDLNNNYHIYRKALKRFFKARSKETEIKKNIEFFLKMSDIKYVGKTSSGFLACRRDDKSQKNYGAYDNDFNKILPLEFIKIEEISSGFLTFGSSGYSLIDKFTGEIILNCSNYVNPVNLNNFVDKVIEIEKQKDTDNKIDKEFIMGFIGICNRNLKCRIKDFCIQNNYEYLGNTETGFMVHGKEWNHFGVFDNQFNVIVPIGWDKLDEVAAGYLVYSGMYLGDDIETVFCGYRLLDKYTGKVILECECEKTGEKADEFFSKVEELRQCINEDNVNKKVKRK